MLRQENNLIQNNHEKLGHDTVDVPKTHDLESTDTNHSENKEC